MGREERQLSVSMRQLFSLENPSSHIQVLFLYYTTDLKVLGTFTMVVWSVNKNEVMVS